MKRKNSGRTRLSSNDSLKIFKEYWYKMIETPF